MHGISVYLCKDKRTGTRYAVKEVVRNTMNRITRLEAEKLALGKSLRAWFDEDDKTYLVMDYFPGIPLYKVIWQYIGLSETFTRQCAAQLVHSIVQLHKRGFMHRDIKTGNVLLDDTGRCALVDYGFARSIDSGRAVSLCGTHYVMAPEIFLQQGYGLEVDWWALGVILYEMIHASPPWPYKCEDGDMAAYIRRLSDPHAIDYSRISLNTHLLDLMHGLLQVNPALRYTASQIQAHPWFHGIEWTTFEDSFPIDPLNAVPCQSVQCCTGVDSAESVTSAENAMFAGF